MFKFLLIFFVPPAYFLIRGKIIQAVLNGFIYAIALVLLISIIGALFAPIPWLFCVVHGWLAWNEERTQRHMKQHVEMMAEATQGSE